MHFSERCGNISKSPRGGTKFPGVAKFGIALEWGSRGLEFESRHSDHENRESLTLSVFIFQNKIKIMLDKWMFVEYNTQAIRVWRSLVSRLNGVQEASSSNLDTRTIKPKQLLLFRFYSFYFTLGKVY